MTGTPRSPWLLGLAAIVIGIAVLVLSGLALPFVGFICDRIGCVLPSTRSAHAQNMAKVTTFKQAFDGDLKPGASFDEVLAYLKVHNLQFGPVGLTAPQDEPPPREGWLDVEMFREKSPHWYCGNGSVGLSVHFVNRNLDETAATYWSLDCP